MNTTREDILLTALRLFARDGFEAVSVSQIAGELGMVKSSLYKHYKNKRDIFDSILMRMEERDRDQAKESHVPEDTVTDRPEAYGQTTLEELCEYCEKQFTYWTEDEFASLFRKLLTLEQFRNEEMASLYQQYLCGGPAAYVADLFEARNRNGEGLALELYAPMFFLYSQYDAATDAERLQLKGLLHEHLEKFQRRQRTEAAAEVPTGKSEEKTGLPTGKIEEKAGLPAGKIEEKAGKVLQKLDQEKQRKENLGKENPWKQENQEKSEKLQKNKEKDKDRDKDRDRDRDREKDKEKDKERDRDKDREKDRGKDKDKTKEKNKKKKKGKKDNVS